MVAGSHQPPFAHPHTEPPALEPSPASMVRVPYAQDEVDLEKVIELVQRRRWMLAGVAIATTVCFWGWTLTRTPIFRGEFQVLVEAIAEVDASQELLQDNQIQLRSTFDYDTQIEVLKSPALLQPVVETLRETYPSFSHQELATNLTITRLRETKVLSVSYRDPDPDKIQAVLDAVADHYLQYSFQQRQTSLRQGVQFVEDQLPELRERVDSLQQRLERFRQEYSLIDPESRGIELARVISSIEEQQQTTQTQLSEAESLYNAIQSQLGYSPEEALAASSLSESTRYQAILNEIQDVEAQIAAESARFLPDTPNVQVLRDRRDTLLPLLDQEAERILGQRLSNNISGNLTSISIDLSRQLVNTANEVQVMQARMRALAAVETQLKQEFDLVPALARQYTDLQRELTIATDSLNRFLETRESLEIEAAQQSIPWQLIAEPTAMTSPIAPNVPRSLMLGAIAGLMLGAGAAFVTDKLDNVFHTPDDLKAFSRLPMLGVVPYVRDLSKRLKPLPAPDESLAEKTPQSYYQSSPFLEAFRSLYTNLRFLGIDKPLRSVVISSAVPSEGKSTVALNLARSAAVLGQRVLLVDADLRLPQIHERLQLPNLCGLSNVLMGDRPLADAIQACNVDENLQVVTSGIIPPDPIQLLSSRSMQQFIQQAEQDFDLVIYDMPPLLGFADSSLLASQTDGMIVVVGLGTTGRTEFKQAIATLEVSPVQLLGVVANGIKGHTTRHYGYHRYHKYYQGVQADQSPDSGSSWLGTWRDRIMSRQENRLSASSSAIAPDPDGSTEISVSHRSDTDLAQLTPDLEVTQLAGGEDEFDVELIPVSEFDEAELDELDEAGLDEFAEGGCIEDAYDAFDDVLDADALPDLTPESYRTILYEVDMEQEVVQELSKDLADLDAPWTEETPSRNGHSHDAERNGWTNLVVSDDLSITTPGDATDHETWGDRSSFEHLTLDDPALDAFLDEPDLDEPDLGNEDLTDAYGDSPYDAITYDDVMYDVRYGWVEDTAPLDAPTTEESAPAATPVESNAGTDDREGGDGPPADPAEKIDPADAPLPTAAAEDVAPASSSPVLKRIAGMNLLSFLHRAATPTDSTSTDSTSTEMSEAIAPTDAASDAEQSAIEAENGETMTEMDVPGETTNDPAGPPSGAPLDAPSTETLAPPIPWQEEDWQDSPITEVDWQGDRPLETAAGSVDALEAPEQVTETWMDSLLDDGGSAIEAETWTEDVDADADIVRAALDVDAYATAPSSVNGVNDGDNLEVATDLSPAESPTTEQPTESATDEVPIDILNHFDGTEWRSHCVLEQESHCVLEQESQLLEQESQQEFLSWQTPHNHTGHGHPDLLNEQDTELAFAETVRVDAGGAYETETLDVPEDADDPAPEPTASALAMFQETPQILETDMTEPATDDGDVLASEPEAIARETHNASNPPAPVSGSASAVDASSLFVQAVLAAQQAIDLGKAAHTMDDWLLLSAQWQRASDLMGMVPVSDANYAAAQRCQDLYKHNSEYAHSRALDEMN